LNRTIEASAFKDRFPKAELVTYRYYVGRKYMFDNSFKEAEEYLRSEFIFPYSVPLSLSSNLPLCLIFSFIFNDKIFNLLYSIPFLLGRSSSVDEI
jgi:hypothetical protein